MRRAGKTAVGKGRIGASEFEQRDFRGAERDRGVGLQMRCNAEPVRGADHRCGSELKGQTDRYRVERQRQALGQRHRAEIFMAVVFRLPAFDPDRPVVAYAVGRQPAFQRS